MLDVAQFEQMANVKNTGGTKRNRGQRDHRLLNLPVTPCSVKHPCFYPNVAIPAIWKPVSIHVRCELESFSCPTSTMTVKDQLKTAFPDHRVSLCVAKYCGLPLHERVLHDHVAKIMRAADRRPPCRDPRLHLLQPSTSPTTTYRWTRRSVSEAPP